MQDRHQNVETLCNSGGSRDDARSEYVTGYTLEAVGVLLGLVLQALWGTQLLQQYVVQVS